MNAQKPVQVVPGVTGGTQSLELTPRLLPDCPIRLGGVFTSGLGDASGANGRTGASSAANGRQGPLSKANRDWIALNCDVVALSPTDIDPDTFPSICKQQKLFTPLLYVYASSLYESEHRGSAGIWNKDMQKWTLRRAGGAEAPYPEPGGHWMDFASVDWANYWTERLNALTRQYSAYGVVVAELPLGNTFAGPELASYHSIADRAAATKTWLGVVRKGYRNLIIPSAMGFDLAAGHATPDPPNTIATPALEPRLWNDYFALTDGAWCEGWVQPYWDRLPVSESVWETQMEAADRAGMLGQVFIAGAAYRNERELEFALASYLLAVHNQGRVVFQPMPIRAGVAPDAGFNLATLQHEVAAKRGYFRVPLGRAMQQRHQIPALGGPVWRRYFQFGDVYVNSDEQNTVTVLFAGNMRRIGGALVRRVTLPPHTGAILLYAATGKSRSGAPPKSRPGKSSGSVKRRRALQ